MRPGAATVVILAAFAVFAAWAPLPPLQAAASPPPGGAAGAAPLAEETTQYGRFGAIRLLRPAPHPGNVVLFFSDEAGWDDDAERLARSLAAQDMLVVGIDTRHYLQRVAEQHDSCAYTAGSLENLSKVIQKRLGFPGYVHPILAGHGSGGALAYGALAQAPARTFRGGIGLALCPDLAGGQPLCPGHGLAMRPAPKGGFTLLPAPSIEQPWVAVSGAADRRCPAATAAALAQALPAGSAVTLAGVDHAFAQPAARWQPALRQAVDRVLAPAAARQRAASPPAAAETAGSPALPGLPVIEMPSPGAPAGQPLAVILSGDGGWASVDREVAKVLSGRRGVPVVGLDTLEYFWNARTPDAAAADLQRLLRHYLAAWKRDRAVLVGYSLGADVLPFLADRLPADLLRRVSLIALLGPSHTTPFEIRIKENKASELPVKPEVLKLRGHPVLCVAAAGEEDSLCSDLGPELARKVELQGSHAFQGDYEQLADRILAAAQRGAGVR